MTYPTITSPRRAGVRYGSIALLAIVLGLSQVTNISAQPADSTRGSKEPACDVCHAVQPAVTGLWAQSPVFAQYFGDRQRVVQIAHVCMAIAVLILVRGNRF